MVLLYSRNNKINNSKTQKLKYITKGGIKWDKIEERDIVGNIKETRVPSTNIEQLGLFKLEFDTNSIIYERIYPSITDIFSNIGGFINYENNYLFYYYYIF